ncbi:MAG: class I tRNA ligase family protein [Actinomycetota bacterium]|nr:class I tRNA ligase family protein [Actinomycetota bacterium]
MERPYDVTEIEARWRERWEADSVGLTDVATVPRRDAYTNVVEFPYPSAEGLHIGHVYRYAGVDTHGRRERMRGRRVFQPIGFDAFGIHTENYALKVGEHPAPLTARTTANFRRQLSRLGMAWDWDHAVDTSDPRYYGWTQWILARLFDAGLMYRAEAPVIWCPSCLTVLAREQTDHDGTVCERCDTPVVDRVMTQWFLRITAYADRLLDGLDDLDWPERAKRLQRQWIGRSEGREIDIGDLTVFTTRPDTLPAVTFVAVAHGHPSAGSTVPHPMTDEPLPVLAADYVVDSYGTGAVMGVPAHDERDRRFAEERGLPVSDAPLLSPGDAARYGRPAVRFRLRDWLISRQRYWGPPIPIVHCDDCGPVRVPDDQLPVLLPHVEDFRPTGSGRSPLAGAEDWVVTVCPACGGTARRETDVSDTFVDSAWYFLRYPSADVDDAPWDPDRTARMLPVDFYAGGPEHVQRHHLYARFVTMALADLGLVPFAEPFPQVRVGGIIVRDGAKMSKSRGNVIGPDELVDTHGADVLRCALLFAAPWDQGGEFAEDQIAGIERFLARVWRVVTGPDRADHDENGEERGAVARAIVAVDEAMDRLAFNVALARLMEVAPQCRSAEAKRVLVRLLAPFAPHLAEELWSRLGEPFSVHVQPWPEADPADLTTDEVEVVVQVDGRVRGRVRVPAGAAAGPVVDAARAAVAELPVAAMTARVVHVPDRLVNLVTVAS